MKHDADIEPADNTSHAQVLDLVGTGRRVLDVGCSTGYLAQALSRRDNTVSGVEIDGAAAEIARPHLSELLIGDLETLDLVAELGQGRFDVIVFADVLEHLSNPLRVLRQAPVLLAPGGSVVVSIPNVAHGAVRLALLEGRFDYRDLGLLDDTHVRFFTRSTVADLHEQAGLTPVDVRRTVLGPFDTEIPLEAADFTPAIIDRIQADPDAATYQFVVRSMPTVDREPGRDLGEELVAKGQELEEARARLRAFSHLAVDPHQPFVAGVVVPASGESSGGAVATALDEMRAMIVAAEMARRLDGWKVQIFEAGGIQGRPATDGTPLWPLPRTPLAYRQATDTLAAMIATGDWMAGPDQALDDLVEGLAHAGCPLHLAGGILGHGNGAPESGKPPGWPPAAGTLRAPAATVGFALGDAPGPARRVVADPLVLADRLFDATLLASRASHLRLIGLLPGPEAHILVHLGPRRHADAGAVARSLQELAVGQGLAVAVAVDHDHDPKGVFARDLTARIEGATLAEELSALDLAAAVAAAALVVSDDAGVLWLALALGRPPIGLDDDPSAELRSLAAWLGDPDTIAPSPAALLPGWSLGQRRAADPTVLRNARDVLELFLDELAGVVATVPAQRLPPSLPGRLADARHRLAVVESVNDALQHGLRKTRLAFGEEARRANLGDGIPIQAYRALQDRLRKTEEDLEVTRENLEAILETRTMRSLAPARRAYSRLRDLL